MIIESEVAFDCQRELDRNSRIVGGPMRDRQHGNKRGAVLRTNHAKHDDAWPIFTALLLPGMVFVMPQVRKIEDKPWLRCRNRHDRQLLSIQKRIQTLMSRMHARLCNRTNLVIR